MFHHTLLIIHSFIHFIFHISIYRLNTKDVEIVIVVVTISGRNFHSCCDNIWQSYKCQMFQYNYNTMVT